MRIGILTGGGDCPALNAVIRAAVKTSVGFGWEVLGIEEGFDGLVHFKTRSLTKTSVSGILHLGGTILGTTNAANPFSYPSLDNSGTAMSRDISDTVVSNFQQLGLDALIVIAATEHLLSQKNFTKRAFQSLVFRKRLITILEVLSLHLVLTRPSIPLATRWTNCTPRLRVIAALWSSRSWDDMPAGLQCIPESQEVQISF
jgi:hypothetical protein